MFGSKVWIVIPWVIVQVVFFWPDVACSDEISLNTTLVVELEDLRTTGEGYVLVGGFGLHGEAFRVFEPGQVAQEGLRALANEGDVQPMLGAMQEGYPAAKGWLMTRLPFSLGQEIHGQNISPRQSGQDPARVDPSVHRYLSYFFKLCPSDDAFIASEYPLEVFDTEGRFTGPHVITLYSSDVMDAGTRENNETDLACLDRAPFTEAGAAPVATEESVQRHPGFNGSVGNSEGAPQRILGFDGEFEYPWDSGQPDQVAVRYDEVEADFSRSHHPIARLRITSGLHGGYSGTYYDPERAGEGVTVEVTRDGDEQQITLFWYTYQPDNSGEPMFLIGQGTTEDEATPFRARLQLYELRGGRFASTDNPNLVDARPWGEMTVEFQFPACENLAIGLIEPLDPEIDEVSGTVMTRLTSLPGGLEKYCGRYMRQSVPPF